MNKQELLKSLEGLNLDELLELYLEAKIGKYVDIWDLFYADTLNQIEELQVALENAIEEAKE